MIPLGVIFAVELLGVILALAMLVGIGKGAYTGSVYHAAYAVR